MVLIFTNPDGTFGTKCSICGQPLSRPIFATSHFIGDERNDLQRYSDSAMHWDCYAAWPHQRRFAAMHFPALVQESESATSQDYWPVLLRDDDSVLVKYGVAVNEISIALRTSGTDIRIPHEDWDSFLASRWTEWVPPSTRARGARCGDGPAQGTSLAGAGLVASRRIALP